MFDLSPGMARWVLAGGVLAGGLAALVYAARGPEAWFADVTGTVESRGPRPRPSS